MEFNDYFKEALDYGKSLGLIESKENSPSWVGLDYPSQFDNDSVPLIYAINTMGVITYAGGNITLEEQIKITELFTESFKKYLLDRKE